MFARSDGLNVKIKFLNDGFVSYKHIALCFTRLQLTDWSVVDYYVCISCLDSHSDGTHSLQSIHW